MKVLRIVALWVVLVSPAQAMSVDSYRKIKEAEKSDSASVRQHASSVLSAYFQGVAETLQAVHSANPSALNSGPHHNVRICVPESVVITNELVVAATDGQLAHMTSRAADPSWGDQTITVFVMFGLARMFPCRDP